MLGSSWLVRPVVQVVLKSAEAAPDEGHRTRDGRRPRAEERRTGRYTEPETALKGPRCYSVFGAPVETGEMLRMKEPNDEGLAHIGSESCTGYS